MPVVWPRHPHAIYGVFGYAAVQIAIAWAAIAHLFDSFIFKNLKTHLGQDFFKLFGSAYEPLFHGAVVLLVFWLILFWMYRRKVFLRL